jgi:hypothetical protein
MVDLTISFSSFQMGIGYRLTLMNKRIAHDVEIVQLLSNGL